MKAALEGGSRDAVRACSLSLALINTSVKISNSRLYSNLTGIHFEYVVLVIERVKWWVTRCGGVAENHMWPKTIWFSLSKRGTNARCGVHRR